MKQALRFQQKNLLTLLLVLVFLWSLRVIEWKGPLLHPGGGSTFLQIVQAMLHPDLSPDILLLALDSAWVTITYAVAGMTIAIVIALILGVLASGVLHSSQKLLSKLSRSLFRGILGFLRAIHELVWALLFVSAFGLTSYSAILAIAIPYGGILGRIFADMLSDVDSEPIQSLKSAGASKWQLLFYGYFPLVKANMISYTMYRFECAVRSSAVMSFVGLGGLGYQIQLSLDDLHYEEVWTFVLVLMAIVVIIDAWSSQWRSRLSKGSSRFSLSSYVVFLALVIGSWTYLYKVEQARFFALFTDENGQYAKKFFLSLLGVGEETPAFFSKESWFTTLQLAYDTLMMSIIAIGISTIVMVITVIPAARNVANGRLTLSSSPLHWISYLFIRASYILSRAVPELIWAMMIIFIFQPGILPGAVALALHNFGILGKLCAEVIEDLDERPIRHLSSSGAGRMQILLYGVLPSVLPKFLSFILYRWEVIMRTTIVVGFVGAGGLGQQFKLSMSYFHYSDITLIILCYLLLVWLADFLSELSRKAAK
jgi:phosphonate transport system permease protein